MRLTKRLAAGKLHYMTRQAIALGHFAVGRTWRWLAVWVALCGSIWLLPPLLSGSYAVALTEGIAGRMLPLGMLAGAVGLYWATEVAMALVRGKAVALRLKDGRITYICRTLISFRADRIASVEFVDRRRDPNIVVHLLNGGKKSIPTTLLAEPPEQIVERIRAAAGL